MICHECLYISHIVYFIYKHIFVILLLWPYERSLHSYLFSFALFCCHKMYYESLFYCIIPLRFLSAVCVNWRKCNFYSISGFIFRFVPRSETCLWHTKHNIGSTCINIRIATSTLFAPPNCRTRTLLCIFIISLISLIRSNNFSMF